MIIGTGVDITEVARLRKAVEKWGESFLDRVFTKEELENAKTRGSLYQHLAGRFAAKEAVFKALGDPGLSWKDVEILNDKDGKPCCVLLGPKARKNVGVHVSISHVKNYAVANAIITQKNPGA
ncbi:MAG: holo-ACP synthase [Candidatus Omnitrophica bacterium]|nr:holo-ACP synthase [Candidatus Omnitrophota bacterium]MDD5553959.1 holo-ACP synthase [Candidatus Omnitrophota bacterium]